MIGWGWSKNRHVTRRSTSSIDMSVCVAHVDQKYKPTYFNESVHTAQRRHVDRHPRPMSTSVNATPFQIKNKLHIKRASTPSIKEHKQQTWIFPQPHKGCLGVVDVLQCQRRDVEWRWILVVDENWCCGPILASAELEPASVPTQPEVSRIFIVQQQ